MLRLGGPVRRALYSKDGRFVVTASDDGTARVWRADDGFAVVTEHLIGHVVDAAISPNDRFLAAAGHGNKASIAASVGELLHVVDHISGSQVHSVAFSPDSKLLVTAADDQRAVVWKVATGKDVSFQSDANNGGVFAATFSPDGKLVATGNNLAPEVWSTATGYNENGGKGVVIDGPAGYEPRVQPGRQAARSRRLGERGRALAHAARQSRSRAPTDGPDEQHRVQP